MKLITDKQAEAVSRCLTYNIPFALFALPGQKECSFFASAPDSDGESHAFTDDDAATDTGDTFFISYFNGDEPYMAGIRPQWDEDDVRDITERYAPTKMLPYRVSTRRESYSMAFSRMRQRLRTHGGKVVLSRHEALFSSRPVIETADEYMDSDAATFRYLCFTPETGLWLGATPELLLSAAAGDNSLHTMALAGTQPALTDEEWDDKNIREHRYVADYISDVLDHLGLTVSKEAPEELHAGAVKHLCTAISASGSFNAATVIENLNPTPAVAGIPLEMAIAEIDTYENHRRRCYSGVVGTRIGGNISAFVNLRCAFAAYATLHGTNGWLYNLYAGGGLMPDSEEEAEWDETTAKTAILSAAVRRDSDIVEENDLRDADFIQYHDDLNTKICQ